MTLNSNAKFRIRKDSPDQFNLSKFRLLTRQFFCSGVSICVAHFYRVRGTHFGEVFGGHSEKIYLHAMDFSGSFHRNDRYGSQRLRGCPVRR